MMTKKTNTRRAKRLRDKELRNKFLADQIKIGLRYQLRSLRDAQGLTQKDLAELIGTKQSVISRLEKKPERVSIPTLLDIAEALDVGVVVRFEAIDTVLGWYSEPTQKKMTPRKSEEILKELEEQSKLAREVTNDNVVGENIIEEGALDEQPSKTGQFGVIALSKTGKGSFYEDKKEELDKAIYSPERANKIETLIEMQDYVPLTHDFSGNFARPN